MVQYTEYINRSGMCVYVVKITSELNDLSTGYSGARERFLTGKAVW